MAGIVALERAQAALEVTRGTALAATRRVYFDRGSAWFEQLVGREFPQEARSSYIANYRALTTSQKATVTGASNGTYDDLPWWLQLYAKGSVTGTLSSTTVYTYTFTPTAGTDDLKTATFEVGGDVQAWQLPFCLGNKLELSWQAGQAVKVTHDLLAQQAIASSFTGSLSDRSLEDILGTTAKVYIDNAGGTIGTTQFLTPLSGKVTLENKWDQITHTLGNLYPDDAARATRMISFELDVHFANAASETEWAHLLDGNERLIRIAFTGTNIAGSSPVTPKSLNIDLYGAYITAPFGTSSAIRTLKLTGETLYDTGAAVDWKFTVANQLSSLP